MTIEAVEPTLYADPRAKLDATPTKPEYTRSDMRVTVHTRDYADYAVACGALADGLAAWLAD